MSYFTRHLDLASMTFLLSSSLGVCKILRHTFYRKYRCLFSETLVRIRVLLTSSIQNNYIKQVLYGCVWILPQMFLGGPSQPCSSDMLTSRHRRLQALPAPSEAPCLLSPGSCTCLDGRPAQGMSYRREIYGSCNLGELLDVNRSCHTLK